ncbi:MAG: ADP-ribose pyrophosphatase [Solirubrobacterales bacterium]|jgi:8-oxo-dGTP pyrophosphatase MutT (NUDIX family)|nr:ADP-ribose pyrophosphatase [Solirubrobacterales bacterium]
MPLDVRSSRIAYANPFLRVREDEFVRPDGTRGVYGVVERADFAAVIAFDGERVQLVRQWRHPVAAWSLELPQGGWDGEPEGDAAALAALELREETGFTAERFEHLGHLWHAVGSSTQGYDVFLATGLTPGPVDRGPDEHTMSVHAHTPAELDALVRDGTVRDSTTLAALQLWALRRGA